MDVIPTKDARLALDIVASTIERGVGTEIAMNDCKQYHRLSSMYALAGIDGPFARSVLRLLHDEGRRLMYSRQPYHVRLLAGYDRESILLKKD